MRLQTRLQQKMYILNLAISGVFKTFPLKVGFFAPPPLFTLNLPLAHSGKFFFFGGGGGGGQRKQDISEWAEGELRGKIVKFIADYPFKYI